MKVLVIETGVDGTLSVQLGADSAVLRPGEPVFVPEPPDDWHSRVMPAVRISRLGMHISEANASRHFDSISLFHVMTPTANDGTIPYGMIDRTFSPGEWLPAADFAQTEWEVSRAKIGNIPDSCIKNVFSLDKLEVHAIISRLSRLATFRTGDVLLFADASVDLGSPVLDTCVEARIADRTILNIRIK